MTFDNFLKKYQELIKTQPMVPTHNLKCENSDFGDYLYNCKNCYLNFDNSECENCFYLFDSFMVKNCIDGDYIVKSEFLYDSVDAVSCNNCAYINYCARIYGSYFCWDCDDSHDLFGCTHLKHKEYCIYNKQFAKDEYFQKKSELLKRTLEENLKELDKLTYLYPVTQTNNSHDENCDYGNQVHWSKNLYLCFDSAYSEDGGYLYDAHHNKNCYDLNQTFHCEFSYECNDSSALNNCFFMGSCKKCFDSGFSYNCYDCEKVMGCVFLRKQKYCFLNKRLEKEEWEKEVKEILESFRQSVR